MIFTASYLVKEPLWQGLLIAFAFIVFFVGMLFAMKLEREAGYYECPHCGHRYVPETLPFWFSMHVGRTRYLKCPNCGKKGWQKKVISRD